MWVIKPTTLKRFWENSKNPREYEKYLAPWLKVVKKARWTNFAGLKKSFRSADAVGDCVVFDVWANHLRVIARVRYDVHKVYIFRVMTHEEYSRNTWPDDCGCHEPPPAKPKKK